LTLLGEPRSIQRSDVIHAETDVASRQPLNTDLRLEGTCRGAEAPADVLGHLGAREAQLIVDAQHGGEVARRDSRPPVAAVHRRLPVQREHSCMRLGFVEDEVHTIVGSRQSYNAPVHPALLLEHIDKPIRQPSEQLEHTSGHSNRWRDHLAS
jgi:hypothetical protein